MRRGFEAYVGCQVSVGVRGCGFYEGRLLASDEELTSLDGLEGQLFIIRTSSIRLMQAEAPDETRTLPRPTSAPEGVGS